MDTTVIKTGTEGSAWGGDSQPLKVSYGKMMMWFFILSDALTFSGFLAAYGFSRFKFINSWPIADEVFNHFPFLHGVDAPMYYVALMTFILIFSSVTMVLAVDAGHQLKQKRYTHNTSTKCQYILANLRPKNYPNYTFLSIDLQKQSITQLIHQKYVANA